MTRPAPGPQGGGGRLGLVLATVLLLLGLGACTTVSGPRATNNDQARATPGLSTQGRIDRAVALLGSGKKAEARAEVVQALVEQPGNPAARSLLGQIDINPKVLLGEKSYPYVVKPGDTFSGLADRLLGDRLMFYALARYNGLDRAADLEVGRTLRIPGAPKRAPTPPPATSPPVQHRPAPAAPPAAAPAPAPAPALRPAAPVLDRERASQYRGAGLRKMNTGEIDAAVMLLQQALALDPGSRLIQNDLARARRIQATLRAR
jgi:hypothetical protein